MTAKLHINISQGVIDVEGDPDLVREIYSDFREQLLNGAILAPHRHAQEPDAATSGDDRMAPTKPPPKIKLSGELPQKGRSTPTILAMVYKPTPAKLDKNLDTSELGAFYGKFLPKNNPEKILIFLKFMTESLEIKSPNTDQVYTCFKHTGQKIPKAFAQAFYDTSTKNGYIDYRSPSDLPITIAGDNYFNHKLQRKAAE